MQTYVASRLGKRADDIVLVSVMPCVAKKEEASRPEMRRHFDKGEGKSASVPDVDYVLTTRELGYLLRLEHVAGPTLPESDFDAPLGPGTGGGMVRCNVGGKTKMAA